METNPVGFCKTCGFHLQTVVGRGKICVNCEVKGDSPTNETNNLKDPGHEAFIKTAGNLIPAKERVLSKDVPQQETVVKEKKSVVVVDDKTPLIEDTVSLSFRLLREYFTSITIKDLNQAKQLLKLRKEIDKLQNKIDIFLGGQNV